MKKFIIHSNKTVTPEGIRNAWVSVEEGKITDVSFTHPPLDQPFIDVGDKVMMPGVIDPHVHINEPGRTEWEGFETATEAALLGGVTTLVDMPLNSSPVTTTVKAFEEKIAAAQGKLNCNCGFWGGVVPGNENEIEPLIKSGVLGFKAFLTHSGIDEFPNVTEVDLRKVMPILAYHKLPLLVHCELLSELKKDTYRNQNDSYQHYLQSRPPLWEDNAIALMIRLCEEFNCPVHIVHLSSANSIQQIKKAKEKGLPITVETAQHYLFFSAEEIGDGQTQYKCAPPIRSQKNNEQLWQALEEGIIDFVATDHSPATPALKELQSGDFMKAWGGISSIQFALTALWTGAEKRNISIENVSKWLSTNPSTLIRMGHFKGKIVKGFDADFIVWDPHKKFIVTEGLIRHKHKITPYMGHELYGAIDEVFLQGEKVVENGNIVKPNAGKIIFNQ